MPPVNYQLSQPVVVTEQFRSLLDRAVRDGRYRVVAGAARYMLDELAYAPNEFGEERYTLPALGLNLRIAFVPPLVVEFAVHEEGRQVFIRRVQLCR